MSDRSPNATDAEAQSLATLLAAFFEESVVGLCLIEKGEQRRVRFANDWMRAVVSPALKANAWLKDAWPAHAHVIVPWIDAVERTGKALRQDDVLLHAYADDVDALERRYFAVTAQPWRLADGTTYGVLLIAREDTDAVTARLRLEKERETQTAMFRMLSHDLRNPIGSAKMAADGICRAKDVPEKITNKARRASQALKRADDMISRFLDLRVLDAGGQLPLQRSETELAEAVEPMVEELNLAFGGRVRLQVEERALGLWDPQYISRAVGNLVENAAKYGDQEAPIHVRLREQKDQVCLEVQNKGATLSHADKAAMMSSKPWRREPGHSRRAGGWGMGLALVRSVTEAHQGHLSIDSAGEQTSMTMCFPRNAQAATPGKV